MNYKIKDQEGNERGPVNEETLLKWAQAGDVLPETPMRNALMGSWKKASDFAFLKEALEAQKQMQENNKSLLQKALSDEPAKKQMEEPERTAFEYKYLPRTAGLPLRLLAALFDWSLIFIFTALLWLIGSTIVYFSDINLGKSAIRLEDESAVPQTKEESTSEKQEKASENNDKNSVKDESEDDEEEKPPANNLEAENPPGKGDDERQDYKYGSIWQDTVTGTQYTCLNGTKAYAVWIETSTIQSVFNKLFFVWILVVLLYFGLGLGLYAQTLGMWFWGIFIAKTDMEEVFLLRAFAFVLLMLTTCILMPAFVFLNPKKRALHDIITNTMIIRIAGKPKN